MKNHQLKLLAAFHFSLFLFPSLPAAVPLRWTVETSRLQPAVFDVVRGETLALEASFQSYGTPVATSNMTAFLCWQTNGMSSAWWTTNAVTSATVARVLFTPDMDPGAPVVHAFLGLSDSTNQLPTTSYQLPSLSYRAAFTLRFRNGPGATPNALPLPTPTIDCQKVTFLHPEAAPFSGGGGSSITTNAVIRIAANQVTNDVSPWALSGNAKPSTDLTPSTNYTDACCSTLAVSSTNISYKAITNEVTSGYLCTVAAAAAMTNEVTFEQLKSKPTTLAGYGITDAYTKSESDDKFMTKVNPIMEATSSMQWGNNGELFISTYDLFVNGIQIISTLIKKADKSKTILGYGITNAYTKTEAGQTFASKATEATVSGWETYWRGDRVRLSVTNYYGNTSGESPRLRIEEFDHSTTNGTVVSNFYHVVWDEIDRQTNYMSKTDAKVNGISNAVMTAAWKQTNLQLVNKAPRAWQSVTSAGEDAPPNMVWHTAPQSVFAGGTEYAHVAVGEGTICVLTDKGAPVYTDGAEGQFRFQDQSGQNYFGFDVRSSYKIGCRTDGISVNSQQHIVSLTYDLTSATNPSILHSTNLVDWADAVVEWEQNPPAGTKVCYINCGNDPKGFYQAEIRYAGGSKFLTNMQADLMGGISASNQTLNVIQSVEPYIISNQVMWRVKQ